MGSATRSFGITEKLLLNEKSTLEPPKELSGEFSKDLKSLKFYGILGIFSNEDYFRKMDRQKYRTTISDVEVKCTQAKTDAQRQNHRENAIIRSEKDKPLELGTFYFLSFVKFLYTLGKITSVDILKSELSYNVSIDNFANYCAQEKLPFPERKNHFGFDQTKNFYTEIRWTNKEQN